MAILPVHTTEVDEFERRLGVSLPDYYKVTLLDPRIQQVLQSKKIGVLHPALTMAAFATLTKEIRRTQPAFPRDGVIVSCATTPEGQFQSERGYMRFLLPDPTRPTVLGDVRYSWDAARKRKIKDCTNQAAIKGYLQYADGDLMASLGLARPAKKVAPSPATEPVYPSLLALLSAPALAPSPTDPDLSEWQACAQLELQGNYLSLCDRQEAPSRHNSLSLQPGTYVVHARVGLSRRGNQRVVRGIRLLQEGALPDAKRRAMEIAVDTGAIAIYDRQPFFRAVRPDDRELFTQELIALNPGPCLVRAGITKVLVVPTGDGDGVYVANELMQGGLAVGVEVIF